MNKVKECAIVLNTPSKIKNIEEQFIIAADGGYRHVLDQNKKPNLVIGDFDSINDVECENIIKLNPIKNQTDGQEALEWAVENNFKKIVFYGLSEGRIDHIMCNLSLLVKAKKQNVFACAKDVDCTIYYLEEGKYSFSVEKDTTISLIANPSAIIANSKGLFYSFNNLLIENTNLGRGVSNKAVEDTIEFDILNGGLFLFINKP